MTLEEKKQKLFEVIDAARLAGKPMSPSEIYAMAERLDAETFGPLPDPDPTDSAGKEHRP